MKKYFYALEVEGRISNGVHEPGGDSLGFDLAAPLPACHLAAFLSPSGASQARKSTRSPRTGAFGEPEAARTWRSFLSLVHAFPTGWRISLSALNLKIKMFMK